MMLHTAQSRAALIEQLESAMKLAEEIGDATTAYLIERALDEARANQVGAVDFPQPSRP
jgi:DNA-binding ferritin-like protein